MLVEHERDRDDAIPDDDVAHHRPQHDVHAVLGVLDAAQHRENGVFAGRVHARSRGGRVWVVGKGGGASKDAEART